MSKYAKRTVLLFTALLPFLLLMTGCSQPAEITLDMSADGSQVAMETGQELVIRLEWSTFTVYYRCRGH